MPNAVVFVNVLEVDPSRQQELIDILKHGTESVIRHREGFVSSAILASADGTRVVNVARWTSAAAVAATQSDPAAAEFARRIAAIARPNPGVLRVAAEYSV